MSNRALKWSSVLLPLLFMLGVLYARLTFFAANDRSGDLFALLAIALGAIMFSILFFGLIERREDEIRQRTLELESLHEAALALTVELELRAVLQKVVDLSRELLQAKYGALGVADHESNMIKEFITAGVSAADRAAIGPPPVGHGLLGVLLTEGEPLVISDISKDPRSIGFPPNHPPMQSLLGVPIKSKGEIFGNLYVADRFETQPAKGDVLLNFDHNDLLLLEKFATQAAIAIENAQLYRDTQELAVLRERQRFGMDLHDGILQSVFATGLSLQEAQRRLQTEPAAAGQRIEQSITELSQVQRDLRNYIMGLRTGRYQGQDLLTSLAEMLREFHANTLIAVDFIPLDKETSFALTDEQRDELLHIVQEALTNIRKHARARSVQLSVDVSATELKIIIRDDGIGYRAEDVAGGHGFGLLNMRERAGTMGADLQIVSAPDQGTRIQLSLPIIPSQT
jgi:signal transduction histidine kinase